MSAGGASPPGSSGQGELPGRLRTLVDDVLDGSGLMGGPARRARADLEAHFRDGLERGRTVDELLDRFGEPGEAARLLSRHPAPSAVGGPEQSGELLRSVIGDIHHAVRGLLKSPGVSITAAIVLAVGLGASTVVFTVLNELLLRPIAVEEPESLVDIWADVPGANSFAGFAYRDYTTFREADAGLRELVAFMGRRLDLGDDATRRPVTGQFVSPAYFGMLGIRASHGTISFADHTAFGGDAVAVLSHAFWSEAYGADPSIVGRTIRLENRPVTVIGVGPAGFSGHFIGFPVDVWLPLAAVDPVLEAFDPDDRTRKELEMIGRLRPGISVSEVEVALNRVAEEIERLHPEVNRGHRVGVTPTTGLDHSLQGAVRTFITILTIVAALVLLVSCLNVGGLLVARAMARDRELAVRAALGAGRVRLLRQLVTESTLLAVLGAVLGVVVAVALNDTLAELLRTLSLGLGLELAIDWRVLGLTAAGALGASFLATVAPALHVLRRSPAGALRARRGESPTTSRVRSVLVVGQVTVSVVLVVATGLFVRALVAGATLHPGFDADRVGTIALDAGGEEASGAEGPANRAELRRQAVRAISEVPGVDDVAAASAPPIGVGRTPATLVVPGIDAPPDADHHVVDVRRVGPGYLEVLGIPLLSGRDIDERDVDGPPVAVVSAAFQRRFGRVGAPVGGTIVVDGREVSVVGVAADARYVVQDETPDALVYLAASAGGSPLPFLTVRAADLPAVTDAVHAALAGAVPGYRRRELRSGREVLDAALLPQRLGAALVGAMGLAALVLAAVGLYGLVRVTVARDTHELGVRLALGGGRRELLLVVLGKGARLVLLGTALGVASALAIAPGLSGFLSGVSPADPITYALVVVCFGVVAIVASGLPALRATRIDPMEALRRE